MTALHLRGHTTGHSGFLIEPDGFLFVADVDLTSFGPFYSDVGSDLAAFEASMRRCAGVDARWYGTGHQKGAIAGSARSPAWWNSVTRLCWLSWPSRGRYRRSSGTGSCTAGTSKVLTWRRWSAGPQNGT
ncbi:hypothetical protein [Streptomyces sp. NBC_01171]|uniref:hypothetical protein n=1 Tax=Streptomyces sp. NBC_01171 TaxID=2903757 RepID=UPI00386B2EF0|nr:hypothetical protein OG448_29950 [Streptomyces sp. NBC_01171]